VALHFGFVQLVLLVSAAIMVVLALGTVAWKAHVRLSTIRKLVQTQTLPDDVIEAPQRARSRSAK
jgi:hypothetical protein